MKMELSRPSNQFWAVFISTIAVLFISWGLTSLLPVVIKCVGMGCFGLMIFVPFIFVFALIISYGFIYPRTNKYLNNKYPQKLKTKTKQKSVKPVALVLGVFLGIVTAFTLPALIGFFVKSDMGDSSNNVYWFVMIILQFSLPIVFSYIWVKVIDKMINK